MPMPSKSDKRWLTPKMRTWLWGAVFGFSVAALGIGLTGGKLSGVGDRVQNVVHAFTESPTTTQPAVQP